MQLHFEYPLAGLGFLIILLLQALMIFNRFRHPESFSWRRFLLTSAALGFCVLGLMRPQLGRTDTQTQSVRSNIFFALDVSKSMLAEDIGPSRLGFATSFAKKLLEQLSGVKVSLFPFTVDGFIQMPLTNDLSVMVDMLQSESPSITTNQGTDISNSLELLFQSIAKMELATTSKGADWFPTQVVLLSDGESHYPIKDGILREYKSKSIPIFTVGIGTKGGSTIPNENNFGQGDYVRDRSGNTVKTILSSETLKKISEGTGGDYFSARFEEVYPLAKRLTQSMRISRLTTSFRAEKEYYPLLFALALLFLGCELSFGRWDYVIRGLFFTLSLWALTSPSNLRAASANDDDPNRAYHAFNQGIESLRKKELPKAAELFQESSLLAKDNVLKKKALFNLADALIRLSDPQSALPVLQQAYDLSTDNASFDRDTNQKISENMALAAKILEQLKKQAQKGEGNDPAEGGEGTPPSDPKGPKKDYKGQLFSEAQKQRIYDLLSNDEQQTIQRLNDQKNKKSSSAQEKPW